MRPLRVVLLACAVGLALTGTALADHLDPEKRITRADQAKARSMLIKPADLGPGFIMQPPSAGDPHVDCPRAVSEADLTLTGDAEGAQFLRGTASVSSAAQVYASVADATASWRRSTSAAGTRCLTTVLRREFAREGVRLDSLRKIAFPRVANRTVAYRILLSLTTPQGDIRLYVDAIVLGRSRAHAQVFTASAVVPPARAEELRLARRVAGRMARALR